MIFLLAIFAIATGFTPYEPLFGIPDEIPMFGTSVLPEMPISPETAMPKLLSGGKADESIAPSAHMSFEELTGDDKKRSTPKHFPDKATYKLVIDKENCVMTVYNNDDGSIARQMLCTIGKPETPSPRGKYSMGSDRVRFGYFKDFDCYAQYWTQITRNVYIHSILYSKKSEKALIRQSYRDLGKAKSHGCVRLSVPDAKWIYENIAPGTKCEFVKRERDEELRESLRLAPLPKKK